MIFDGNTHFSYVSPNNHECVGSSILHNAIMLDETLGLEPNEALEPKKRLIMKLVILRIKKKKKKRSSPPVRADKYMFSPQAAHEA